MNKEWNIEFPKESGYYLAVWKHGGDGRSTRVSEFWFDGRNWWTGRGYLYIREGIISEESMNDVTDNVIAWMPKPKFRVRNK